MRALGNRFPKARDFLIMNIGLHIHFQFMT